MKGDIINNAVGPFSNCCMMATGDCVLNLPYPEAKMQEINEKVDFIKKIQAGTVTTTAQELMTKLGVTSVTKALTAVKSLLKEYEQAETLNAQAQDAYIQCMKSKPVETIQAVVPVKDTTKYVERIEPETTNVVPGTNVVPETINVAETSKDTYMKYGLIGLGAVIVLFFGYLTFKK